MFVGCFIRLSSTHVRGMPTTETKCGKPQRNGKRAKKILSGTVKNERPHFSDQLHDWTYNRSWGRLSSRKHATSSMIVTHVTACVLQTSVFEALSYVNYIIVEQRLWIAEQLKAKCRRRK